VEVDQRGEAGGLALDDLRQLAAQVLGRNQTLFRTSFAGGKGTALRGDPFAEIGRSFRESRRVRPALPRAQIAPMRA
jgi:hypothetical protein